MTVLSFSILALILFSCSTCSCISAVASACFFLRPTMVASCWILASSRSLLSLDTSASLFLFSSIWALVAPLASLSLSPRFSSSLARSDLCLSALALPCLSASSSSSISSILAWISLMVFWTLATRDCSSSSLFISDPLSFSLRWMALSNSFLDLSSSETVSCMILSSPSILLLVGALQLIQSRLQLALDLVQVADLVLGDLQVLHGLGGVLADVLLLLVELVDDLVLVGDLIIETLDGVISVSFLLLELLDCHVDVINVHLDGDHLLLQDLLVLHGVLAGGLSLGELVLSLDKFSLEASHLGGALGLLVVVDGQVALLLLQLGQERLLLLLDGLILLKEPLF